ncbi:hypothetical protein DH2020_038340 [Rehmannia glutinosa]|uniref:Uncharacterized protein n=1 Tax=Rehmannia glutinosa TaxID=99300 RepID=A0ABR0UZ69_REHGL
MVLLCFVLDLRNLSPPILRDLKQSLLQLANYYAVSSPKTNNSFDGTQSNSKPLPDRIGLCYVSRNQISCSDELKIAYNPHGNFNLRDLHHALNNLPTDAFSQSNDSGALCRDLKLADVLSEKILYTWGGHDKKIARKVISISSCLVDTLDSATMKALMDAANKNVLVEFIFLEQTSNHLGDITENISHLVKQTGSLKNCSFRTCIPVYLPCLGQCPRSDERDKGVYPRCHGIPLDHSNMKPKRSSCPVTKDDPGGLDIIENSVRVGEQTILYMPSFQGSSKPKQVSSSIDFNVIQRTNLGTLSEGLIMGATYFVTPSTVHGVDDNNKSELNRQLFQVVCSVLNSLDQGLVCSSTCNIETGMETSFQCYYILLPSDKGLMLLRRLSALEEFLPIPDVSHLISSVVVEEIENTVQSSLLQIEESDYNPAQHERGFHKKLNFLVKESLQFGAIHPKSTGVSESDLDLQSPEDQPSKQAANTVVTGDEQPQRDIKLGENKTGPCLTEEWEKLIVTELGVIMPSPTCNPNSKLDQLVITSPSQSNRQLDEKTSRILERLEIPRQLKRKAVSPTVTSSLSAAVCAAAKKPLIPFKATDGGPITSQPLKPSFQKIKKKI